MSGKIISIVNRKGGVAKTTLTLGLADTFCCALDQPYSAEENRVVVVDLDPQGSLTRALLYDRFSPEHENPYKEAIDTGKTLANLLEAKLDKKSHDLAKYLTFGVGPIGADYALLANDSRTWDVERKALKKPGEERLKSILKDILTGYAKVYKYVLIDCPPGQTVLAEAAVECSDVLLCPIIPDYLTLWGLASFEEYLRERFPGKPTKPPARYVLMKFVQKPPRHNPQVEVIEKVRTLGSGGYVNFLYDPGGAGVKDNPLYLPLDSHIPVRLLGAPKLQKRFLWDKMYKDLTREKLTAIALGVRDLLAGEEQSRGR